MKKMVPNQKRRNKKFRYREKHSASVVLSWCTISLWRKSVAG